MDSGGGSPSMDRCQNVDDDVPFNDDGFWQVFERRKCSDVNRNGNISQNGTVNLKKKKIIF